jgi:hypothetical protein
MATTVIVIYGRSSDLGGMQSGAGGEATSRDAGRVVLADSGEGGMDGLPFWKIAKLKLRGLVVRRPEIPGAKWPDCPSLSPDSLDAASPIPDV